MLLNRNNRVAIVLIPWLMLISMILFACGGGGGGGGGSNDGGSGDQSDQSQGILYTNPTDSRLFSITETDGTTITYHGDKDEQGYVSSLNSISVQTPSISGDVVFMLDQKGMPETIFTPEAIFELSDFTESSFQLKAIADSGDIQVSVPIQLEADTEESSKAVAMDDYTILDTQSGSPNVQIRLTRCGNPVENALITMDIFPSIDNHSPIGNHTGDGYYSFYVPSAATDLTEQFKQCEEIATKVGAVCTAWDIANFVPFIPDKCSLLTTVVNQFPWITEPYKSIIANNCDTVLKLLPKICTLQSEIDLETECKLYQFHHGAPKENHSFTLTVKTPGGNTFSTDPIDFNPNTESQWELEAPAQIVLDKFYIEPSNPKISEWYTAKASLVCPDPDNGTDVTLSVVGSDGHKGSTGERMTANSQLSLDIPPSSDPGQTVTDTITVEAEGLRRQMVVKRQGDGDGTSVEVKKHYVFMRSGTGWRKLWYGWEEKREGYDYFTHYLLPSEVAGVIANNSKFAEATAAACAGSPALCPCATYPDIWVSGTGKVEVVASFDTVEELEPYRCDTYQFDPSNIICTQWTVTLSERNGWENVNGICGN